MRCVDGGRRRHAGTAVRRPPPVPCPGPKRGRWTEARSNEDDMCSASPSVWRSAKRGACELPTGRRSQINWAEPVFGSPHGKSINYNYQ